MQTFVQETGAGASTALCLIIAIAAAVVAIGALFVALMAYRRARKLEKGSEP